MKKKIFAIILVLAINTPAFASSYLDTQIREAKKNTKYSTTQKQIKATPVNVSTFVTPTVKDPHLIKLSTAKPVDVNAYNAKIKKDEAIYKSKIIPALNVNMRSYSTQQPLAVDFYEVYRITERLIRANNLDYVNWRVAIRKTEDKYNAASTEANFIYINTALYDSLYTNEDALAFVIAHEMAHLLLGHQQRIAEMTNSYDKWQTAAEEAPIFAVASVTQKKRVLYEMRKMEYVADIEGAMLMTKAGFDMKKGMEALNFVNVLPHVQTWSNSHPMPEKRIANMNENLTAFDSNWVNEGNANIMSSDVLDCKKSSDRVSIVISKNPNFKKVYTTENVEQRVLRIAYASYKSGKMENAIKYFGEYADMTNSYVPYLYMSYANEYLYNVTKNSKYLTQAKKAAEKANELNPNDQYVKEQIDAL